MSGRLIALGGRLRSGKDTVADHLVDAHGFVKMGMSDVLNEALLKLNPWIPKETLGPVVGTTVTSLERYQTLHDRVGYVEAKKNSEVRRLLQVLGTEVGREMIDPNVWVDMARRDIEGYLDSGRSVVITAVRFPNEIEMIRALGGTTVWIERAVEARGASEAVSGHASEQSVSADDFEYVIENNSTIAELWARGDELLEVLEPITRISEVRELWPPYDR